jgi:predicted TIM-barrel fold metal-dependent hydrolase
MLIDCHCHANTPKLYNQYKIKSRADKTILIRESKRLINDTDVNSTEDTFYKLLKDNNNLYGIEVVSFYENIYKQLIRIKRRLNMCNKIIGIKFYPGYEHFYPNNKRLYKAYKFAEKNNLVVVFHSGDVWDKDNKAQVKYTHPKYIDDIATYFPNVKFVISHFAFPYMLETAMIVNKNKNVYTDISGNIQDNNLSEYFYKDIKRCISYYPNIINKIMHGCDFCGNHTPLNNIIEYEMFVRNNFNKEDIDKILYKNAKNIYGI